MLAGNPVNVFAMQVSFAAAPKAKQCKTGYSCGYSCVARDKNCRSPLDGQAKNYADWLTGQAVNLKSEAGGQTVESPPPPSETPASSNEKRVSDPDPSSNEKGTSDSETLDSKSARLGVDKEALRRLLPLAIPINERIKAGEKYPDAFSEEDRQPFNELTGLIKAGRGKVFLPDGSEAQIPAKSAQKLQGSRTIYPDELSLLGVKDASSLTPEHLIRLSELRNGFKTVDQFLSTPPGVEKDNFTTEPEPGLKVKTQKIDRDVVIYAGERVYMAIAQDGNVEFTVDGAFSLNDRDGGGAPSSELKAMTKAWNKYVASPAAKRMMYTVPTTDDERGQTRVKLYEKRGFEITKGSLDAASKGDTVLMVLNNKG